jgi:hypothetical protein
MELIAKTIATAATVTVLVFFTATAWADSGGTRPVVMESDLNLQITGEMKTGVFWDDWRQPQANMHHNDYAGAHEGRLRLGLNLDAKGFGIRTRISLENWAVDPITGNFRSLSWDYAYAFASFFDNQLRLAAGNLEGSPWRAGGPDIWQALDHRIGMRVEISPAQIPGLLFGFAITEWNTMTYFQHTLIGLLTETTFGVTYTNDYFHAALGWRLDGVVDVDNHNQEGQDMMYRLEPRFLGKMVPGLRLWINGWWKGIAPALGKPVDPEISNEVPDDLISYTNWLYIEYEWRNIITDIRMNLDLNALDSHMLRLRSGVFYRFLPNLRAGAALHYHMNFGPEAEITGVPFAMMGFEPEVQFWFGGGSSLALVYRHEWQYDMMQFLRERNWVNLRAVISF